jgi:hypothetical protein
MRSDEDHDRPAADGGRYPLRVEGNPAGGDDAAVRVAQFHSGGGPVQAPPVGRHADHQQARRHAVPPGGGQQFKAHFSPLPGHRVLHGDGVHRLE